MSQTELATSMGLRPGNINRYVTGSVEPKISALEKIAKELNVEPHTLIMPDTPKESPTVSSLSKLVEQQSKMLDGNEELLELWNKIDHDTKGVLMKQIRNFAQKEKAKKAKA